MAGYVGRRLVFSIFVIWGVITIIFFAVRFAPGDPVSMLVGADATPEVIEMARVRLGLDRPLVVQYLAYLGAAVQFDFGTSIRMGQDVDSLVLGRVPATAKLAVAAMSLALTISLPLGVLAALKPRSIWDRMISTSSLIGQSIPNFWLGIMLILVFARAFNWLPSAGDASWKHFVLPSVTLALPFLSILVRLTRSGLLEVMHEGYIETARSKGLRESAVIYSHALKNMMIPVVTVAGLQFGALLGGTVIVETVFAWPGIGRLLVDAINGRDFPVVQAAVALIAASFVLVNLAVDVLYGYLDPRVRVGE